ncbi:hypothetical protein OG21DRAFT_1606220 [Imleria badia]|nr:hypothetical protein OG21DRAFT_1606220 [Imleria badia]
MVLKHVYSETQNIVSQLKSKAKDRGHVHSILRLLQYPPGLLDREPSERILLSIQKASLENHAPYDESLPRFDMIYLADNVKIGYRVVLSYPIQFQSAR